MRSFPLIILTSAALLTACTQSEAPGEPGPTLTVQPAAAETSTDGDLERAKRAALDFSTTLKQRLMANIRAEGPASSIGFCKDEAPRIASEMAIKHGVKLGRVPANGKLRNPNNAPAGWQQTLVDDLQAKVDAGQTPDQLAFV